MEGIAREWRGGVGVGCNGTCSSCRCTPPASASVACRRTSCFCSIERVVTGDGVDDLFRLAFFAVPASAASYAAGRLAAAAEVLGLAMLAATEGPVARLVADGAGRRTHTSEEGSTSQ